jgi:RNA polymerase sigma-70 factor (ECF subfamily)
MNDAVATANGPDASRNGESGDPRTRSGGTVSNCDSRDEFVRLLTSAQPRLFSYLAMVLGDVHDANNVLQEANVTLWTKADEFTPGTNFLAWAREVAYFKALAFVRDRKRDKLIVDQDLIERVAAGRQHGEIDQRRASLRHCLSHLNEKQMNVLRMRYSAGASIAAIASQEQKSEAAVKMSLRRLRLSLMTCIQRRLALAK